ncbi:unannotated protein [freshwater metagenome]|uniref:Unannotated protein n=1 Tax=freshwater metagenome TaxID=449393 RepID=A0A6J6U1W5_9ZZZZ
MPYANEVAIAATEVIAIKKILFNIAILIPISATRRALPLKFEDSAIRSP